MNKNLIKTESVAEFIARGGVITRTPAKEYKKPTQRQLGYEKEVEVIIEPDMSALPTALKIRYGIR